jgi:hypothetical protein
LASIRIGICMSTSFKLFEIHYSPSVVRAPSPSPPTDPRDAPASKEVGGDWPKASRRMAGSLTPPPYHPQIPWRLAHPKKSAATGRRPRSDQLFGNAPRGIRQVAGDFVGRGRHHGTWRW